MEPTPVLVEGWRALKSDTTHGVQYRDRGGPDVAPNREMERQARSPPLRALSRKEKGTVCDARPASGKPRRRNIAMAISPLSHNGSQGPHHTSGSH